MEDDKNRNHSHNENKLSRHLGFLTGTAHRQHKKEPKVRPWAARSQILHIAPDNAYTKRESTDD